MSRNTTVGIYGAGATTQARMNEDFKGKTVRDEKSMDGQFYRLSDLMKESLLAMALQQSEKCRKEQSEAIKKQREHKLTKKQALIQEKWKK